MPASNIYEVLALRYAENPAQPASKNFIDGDAHDRLMPLDYFIWLIRGPDRTYVIDTGFDAQAAKDRSRLLLAARRTTLLARRRQRTGQRPSGTCTKGTVDAMNWLTARRT